MTVATATRAQLYSPFRRTASQAVANSGYVVDVVINPSKDTVAAPTSTGQVHLFDTSTLAGLGSLTVADGNHDTLKQIIFDTANPSLVYAGSASGAVRLWDVRTGQLGLTFQCDKPVLTVAINSSQTMLAAGTELVGEDSEICIWDVRNQQTPAARFLECHSDDITQLRFHPSNPLAMISGSTDGLVCLYNLETLEEDDALYQVVKEDSISKIGFFGPHYEYIYCLTHMETFSLYKFLEGDKVFTFGDVRGEAPETKVDYLIDCAYDERGERMFLITGDQNGNLAILHVNLGHLDVVHTLNGGHSDIVRGAAWDLQRETLISGGEDGVISLWQNS
ncbi:WD repeat-containing protein 89 [Geranomyces michiganensis]|nr:WD repeat-containing protein 89 [Geranomyces michiganensis]